MINQRKWSLDYHLLLLLLIPPILLLSNRGWFFPWIGGPTDGWLNDLYFKSYGTVEQLFSSYKLARLSWILKGWAVHHLFSPIVAYYILNLFIFYVCIIAFYYVVKLLFKKNVALLGASAFATYSQFHSVAAFEWDYHTHDSTANILLTLLFLLLATRRSHWKLYLFFAGTFCASAFQSPFVMLHFMSVIFWYLYLNHGSEQRHSLWKSGALFAFGVVTMTLIYCLINYSVGGPFWYFRGQIPGGVGWAGQLSSYAYQPSYWQSLHDTLLHNKGMIVPILVFVLSIPLLILLLKKNNHHLYKKPMLLCLVTFYLCLPIPLAFQLSGWPVLSLEHWQAGMDQFVFLAATALFAFLLPELQEMKHSNWPNGLMVLFAFIIFCGVLVFGLTVQRALESPWRFDIANSIQILVLLAMYYFVSRHQKLLTYSPLLVATTIVTMFSYMMHFHKVWSILLLTIVFINLWMNRKSQPIYLRNILVIASSMIFSALFFLNIHSAAYFHFSAYPLLMPIFVAVGLYVFVLLFPKLWRTISVFSLIALFAVGNIASASIPLALYDHHYRCNYLSDMYQAVMDGEKILRHFDKHFNMLLWFRYENPVPSSNAYCSDPKFIKLGQLHGMPMGEGGVFGALSITAGAGATTMGLVRVVSNEQFKLFNQSLATLPNAQYWRRYAPEALIKNPHAPFSSAVPLVLLRNDTLSHFDDEKFWLHVFPAHFKWVIMDNELLQIQAALASFQRYGYQLTNQKLYRIQDGQISYYIVTGYLDQQRT